MTNTGKLHWNPVTGYFGVINLKKFASFPEVTSRRNNFSIMTSDLK